ncbi:MAG: TIGR03745 family integrating conjugative element membrane protein [Pseudomonas sp.]|nr:TIGR03745 family integrating conjugative element membrane protein [Pseudomonas sp.]
MLKTLRKAKASAGNTLLMLFCSIATAPAFAGGGFAGVDAKSFLTDAKGTAGQGFNFAGLVVAALGFLGVAYYAIAVFSEVQKGKKTWTDFGAVALVGAIMLVVVFWMLGKMGGISALTGINAN